MKYRLDELFDLQMGKTPLRSNPEYWRTTDNKWISISDLSACDKYVRNTKEYISNGAVVESGINQIPANTVVMSFKLSIGKTAITCEPMYSNEAIMSFRDKHLVNLLPEYIYYLLSAHDWSEGANKAVMGKTLNKATLSKVKVYIHSADEQKKIVAILNKTAEIIQNQRQMLQKLDELVKARFIEMFGEPLSNERSWNTMPIIEAAPIKSTRGDLSNEIWLLNLDAVESQTGKVLYKQRVHKSKINTSTVYFTTDDVLYSKLRPYLNKVVIPDEDGVATSEMLPMCPKSGVLNREYLCYWLRSDAFVRHISEKVAGAKMPRVSMEYFRSIIIEVPPIELQEKFANFVAQVDKSKVAVQNSLDEAQLLFDSLMQKYFG